MRVMIRTDIAAIAAVLIVAAGPSLAQSQTPAAPRVTPGEFIIDPPTLINLGFEWMIEGDGNRNASVAVSYRRAGDAEWKTGMPLVRLQHERVFREDVFNLVLPNMFAGSILDVEPGTAYEVRLAMSDPDGIDGPAENATQTVTVSTRPEPMPAEGGNVYHVYPVGYEGPRMEPSFTGLMCAYNYYCGAGDTAPGGRPRVKAGDVILMHAGTYAYRYEIYANQMLGQGTAPAIFSVNTETNYSSSDYNGFRPNPGQTPAFQWNSPASPDIRPGTADSDGPAGAASGIVARRYATFEEYRNATGQDRNSVLVDYDIFVNVPQLDRDPATVQRLYNFDDLDFRLRPGSVPIDRGTVIPNINDGFAGTAPDLGALEAGQPMPVYGPRNE